MYHILRVYIIEICGNPPTIANAEVMSYNNKAMYSCMEGYRSMSGINKINCTKSEWETTTFSCYGRIHLYRVDLNDNEEFLFSEEMFYNTLMLDTILLIS